MFFIVEKEIHTSLEQLKTRTVLKAFYIIQKYPMLTSEALLEQYIQRNYSMSLKNMCIKLLLNLTHYKNIDGNLVLLFKNPEHDKIARLITYGTAGIPGSNILKASLK